MEEGTQQDNQFVSRKERRALKRLMKDENVERSRRMRAFRRVAFWLVGLAVVAGIIFGLVKLSGNAPVGSGQLVEPVTASDWSKGPAEATVTLVEYSDFQCPACGAYYPLIKQLGEDYKDKVKIVYRHFPLRSIHPNAQLAAQAAEAAGMQGKFWEMHDILFEKQDEWSSTRDNEERFTGYASTLELNVEKFKKDLTSDEVKSAVQADVDGGVSASVNATPTFFLNGVKIASNPQGLEPFKALIEETLKESANANPSPSLEPTP